MLPLTEDRMKKGQQDAFENGLLNALEESGIENGQCTCHELPPECKAEDGWICLYCTHQHLAGTEQKPENQN